MGWFIVLDGVRGPHRGPYFFADDLFWFVDFFFDVEDFFFDVEDFFFDVDFFFAVAFFFDVDFFSLGFSGTLPPSSRASDRPIAIACLGFVTFLPEPPERSVPCFISCIAFSTFSDAFFP
jgi:hypothetical protein